MAGDGNTQTVRFVQKQSLDCPRYTVRKNNSLADQFRLSNVIFPHYCGGALFGSGHCVSCLDRIMPTVQMERFPQFLPH